MDIVEAVIRLTISIIELVVTIWVITGVYKAKKDIKELKDFYSHLHTEVIELKYEIRVIKEIREIEKDKKNTPE